jgi:hypothetical protein
MSSNPPLPERTKTEMRLPDDLHDIMSEIVRTLGISINAFGTLAIARLCAELVPAMHHHKGAKKGKMLEILSARFQQEMHKANSVLP